MRTINIALFGTGTVGSGVIRIIQKHHDGFLRHAGVDIQLVAVNSRSDAVAASLGLADHFRSADDIFADPSIDVVVELIGGTGYAREVIERALRAGKSVVTANKAVMASCGGELMQLADENGCHLAFEASVGGGIPIIAPLKHCLVSNEISSVLGIVNGTTNYMLTRMAQDGLTYEAALAEAQERGFAEADPTADVDGFDAAAKIAILASIAFNSRVTIEDVHPQGIRSIQPLDFEYADRMGYVIKLLAIANRTDGGIDVRVHPTMIPKSHPLSGVNGVYNAIYVTGDAVGETMFFGEGAGSGPAASAVVGDIIEVARLVEHGVAPIVSCTCTDHLAIRPMNDLVTRYYVRLDVADQAGVLAATSAVFSRYGVSISSMMQQDPHCGRAQIIFLTHRALEADLMGALEDIAALPAVDQVATIIRVEGCRE